VNKVELFYQEIPSNNVVFKNHLCHSNDCCNMEIAMIYDSGFLIMASLDPITHFDIDSLLSGGGWSLWYASVYPALLFTCRALLSQHNMLQVRFRCCLHC